jgi:hypothetical protein
MTVSKLTLQKNLTDALILMVQTAGDRELKSVSFNPLERQFEKILKTTWTDLETGRYVTSDDEQDSGDCRLLPKGWLKGFQEAVRSGLPLRRRFQTPIPHQRYHCYNIAIRESPGGRGESSREPCRDDLWCSLPPKLLIT